MITDYVKRHGLKPAMRAFSVNDTMINGAPRTWAQPRYPPAKTSNTRQPPGQIHTKKVLTRTQPKVHQRNDNASHHIIITAVSFRPHQKFPDFCPVTSPPVCNTVN